MSPCACDLVLLSLVTWLLSAVLVAAVLVAAFCLCQEPATPPPTKRQRTSHTSSTAEEVQELQREVESREKLTLLLRRQLKDTEEESKAVTQDCMGRLQSNLQAAAVPIKTQPCDGLKPEQKKAEIRAPGGRFRQKAPSGRVSVPFS